jgi:hypothetical protein
MSRSSESARDPGSTALNRPVAPHVVVLLLLMVALALAMGPHIDIWRWELPPTSQAWLEAAAWYEGHADLGVEDYDYARFEGRFYNPLPPMLTFICAVAMPIQRLAPDIYAPDAGLYPLWYVLITAGPIPFLGYWAFWHALRRRPAAGTGSEASAGAGPRAADAAAAADDADAYEGTEAAWRRAAWAGALTFILLACTPMTVTFQNCRVGVINCIHQAYSQTGLLLILGDTFGRRRAWPAALGLVIAVWSRQLTLAYAAPLLWIHWRAAGPHRVRRVGTIAGGAAIALAGLMTVSALRFGSPFDDGYGHIFNRPARATDVVGARVRAHGQYSWHHVPFNFYIMNLAIPEWEWSPVGPRVVPSNRWGASFWFATPVLLLLFRDARAWWRDPVRRALVLGSLPIIVFLLFYYSLGSAQLGQYRYALDWIPIWLAALAPRIADRSRRVFTLCTLAWSAWYFSLLYLP